MIDIEQYDGTERRLFGRDDERTLEAEIIAVSERIMTDAGVRAARNSDRRGRMVEVAVLVPCRDEVLTIAKVVRDFRRAIPGATVYVYDNCSTDGTAAADAGAIVRYVPSPGKGNVLRQMFMEVDAAVYLLVDGDDTYDALAAPELIDRLRRFRLDMVVGRRIDANDGGGAYRLGHRLGNRFLSRVVHALFANDCVDLLSGYRVFSRRYVKSFPALSTGFETETEMTVHALDLCLPFEEVPVGYQERPSGSCSKLHTISDGLRILWFSLMLCKDYRPLRFFGLVGLLAGGTAAGLAVAELHAGSPASGAAAALGMIAVVSVLMGVILDTLRRSRREMKRMQFLAIALEERHSREWSDDPIGP